MLNYKIFSSDGTISLQKPVLVFLHGLGGSSAIWLKQVRKLKQKYDLLLIDLPSHGKNNINLSNMQKSFRAISDKILEVLNFLNIHKAVFIGCSIGTIFIKYLVLTNPEIVEKFILIGGVGTLQSWFKAGINLAKFALMFLPAAICYKIVGKLIIPKSEYEEGRNLFIQCSKHIPKKEMFSWLQLLAKFPKINKEYLKKISEIHNGLYITGKDDKLFLPMLQEEFSETENKKFLDNCGHLCNLDKPDEVNELIDEFVCT